MITQKIKRIFTSLAAVAVLLAPGAFATVPAFASVTTQDLQDQLCSGTNVDVTGGTSSCTTSGDGGQNLNTLLTDVVNIFSAIVGVIAVIMIIYGGFRYITSGGDQNRVASAKNTLIYAIIGLVIVALAQIIVHFVLQKAGDLGA